MNKKKKLPKPGPRNPCLPPLPFPKGTNIIHVNSKGAIPSQHYNRKASVSNSSGEYSNRPARVTNRVGLYPEDHPLMQRARELAERGN